VSIREKALDHDAAARRFGVVASRFNERHVRRLLDGALETLRRQGAAEDAIEVWWVPGALELPLAARWMAERLGVDAVIALGVVLRGETEHFRLVAEGCSRGLAEVALATGVPVTNGVLACHDVAQVVARTGGDVGNAGSAAALAAVAMANLRGEAGAG
jgi:6,7-dimethyl-8-ribityllumazine synthase